MQISMKRLRTKLNRSIIRFRKLQKTYTPAVFQALEKKNLADGTLGENVPLLLPSALTPAERARCVPGLTHIEGLLRDAQCRLALVELRNKLHIKSRFLTYKKYQARHQGSCTRTCSLIACNEVKIRLSSEKYQSAWESIRLLNDGDATKVGWTVLRRDDIRCMQNEEDLKRKAKQRHAQAARCRKKLEDLRAEEEDDMDWEDEDGDAGPRVPENECCVSWIWMAAGTSGTDEELEDGKSAP